MNKLSKTIEDKEKIFLIIIIVIGILLRVLAVLTTPGLWGDEAINANDALLANQEGMQWFYPMNNGREGLYINMMAIIFKIFGSSIVTLRMTSAVIGIITIPVFYLAAKAILSYFIKKRIVYISMLATFLVTVSHWHIAFSRIGFRAILGPLLLSAGLYFLLKNTGSPQKRLLLLGVSGFFIGLGMHSYIAFRLIPIIFVLYLLIESEYAKGITQRVKTLTVWISGFFLAFAPLLVYFLQNPGSFVGRSSQVSVMASSNPLVNALTSTAKTVGMFNITGDCNPRHGINCLPQLDPITGIVALLGFAVILFHIYRNWWSNSTKVGLLLVALFGASLVPAIATLPTELPHALRVIIAIPLLFIFAGLGWQKLSETKRFNFIDSPKFTAGILISVLLLNSGIFFYHQQSTEARAAFHPERVQEGYDLIELARNSSVAFVISYSENPSMIRPLDLEHYEFFARGQQLNASYLNLDDVYELDTESIDVFVFTHIHEKEADEFAEWNGLVLSELFVELRIYERPGTVN